MPGLGTILSALDKRVRTLQAGLEQARQKVRRTKSNIADAEKEIGQLQSQLETINTRFNAPNLDNTTRRTLHQQGLSIEASLGKAAARRAAEEKNLTKLLSAREEEHASEQLQEAYADALVEIHSLLTRIGDGTVNISLPHERLPRLRNAA